MARHVHRGEVYEYYFWPLGISTPQRLDNALGEYRVPFSGMDRLWGWLRWHSLIRCRHLPNAAEHLAGGA